MDVDYRLAFENSPIGQAIARHRVIVACNAVFARMFRGAPEDFVEQSFERLYPSQADYEEAGLRVGSRLASERSYTDERVMRRLDGQLFWVHVGGYTHTPSDSHSSTLWVFGELAGASDPNLVERSALTPRERDVAAQLIEGKTAKQAAKALNISHRTVDIYRSRLLKKYDVTDTRALVSLLLRGYPAK